MREIHYIDIDEEIISAVSRLRNSSQGENVFIFPKRALILQSIINLRLLEREASKLGKRVIVVSQDEAGRKLAEKAGLVVEEYQDQLLQGAAAKETTRFVAESTTNTKTMPLPEQKLAADTRRLSAEIGSESFFAVGSENQALPRPVPSPLPTPTPQPQKLHIRNMSPNLNPGLNSVREETTVTQPPQSRPVLPQRPITAFSDGVTAPQPSLRAPLPIPRREPVPRPSPAPQPMQHHESTPASGETLNRSGKLARFMGSTKQSPQSTPTALSQNNNTRSQANLSKHSSFPWAWTLGGVIVLAGIGLAGFFVLFPKTTITLQPQTAEQIVRFQGTIVTDDSRGENIFPGRVATLERTVQVSEETTGSAAGIAKARGKIKIYNNFSSDSQPLVATTRFETKDGKIFRLLEGVVVPGMSEKSGQKERGMIEATVVADEPGGNYNITPTTFTIPGFKGSPKFDAFTAESTQAFTGGDAVGTDSQKTLITADIDRAKTQALEEAKKAVLEDLRSTLAPGEVILEDSMLLTERPGAVYPALGTAQSTFTYETRFETKTFVIDEAAVRERIANERLTAGSTTLFPQTYSIRYTSLLPKYDTGRTDITVESTIKFQAQLNIEKIKEALLGQDEDGIRQFLERHPEVERLQVEFHPKLIISTISKQASRVQIEMLGQEKP